MRLMKLIFTILLAGVLTQGIANAQSLTEAQMIAVLETYDSEASLLCNKNSHANWNVQTDVLNETLVETQNLVILEYAAYRKKQFDDHFKAADIDSYTDPLVKRKLQILKDIGTAALSDDDLTSLNAAKNRMTQIYNNGRICPFDKPSCALATEGLTLDPEIEVLMSSSTDFDEMKWTWEQWHEKSGKSMRDDYKIYVDFMNKAAEANGHVDAGEMWRARYEDDALIEKVDKLWDEVQPLYNELHKYVRYQLSDLYGDKVDKKSEFIPAHLLGNMWAQNWVHLYDRIKPFKNASLIDVTHKMESLNYNAKKLFELSDEFYMSMGLPSSAVSYSDKAVIEKPEKVIACHASAWDFCDGQDFRIKMCTKVNQEDFVVVHHEMGHIMYYLLYKDQPLLFRSGANNGFHEAVGDTIALSVSTPQHLEKIGLLQDYTDSEADNINALLHMALERIAFLPFGLLIDKWRWDVFSGNISMNQWNKHWWELREKYQKVQAPSPRGEEFFDPGAKYHVPADTPYIRYFVAHILQFSFYKSLCIEAAEYDPSNPAAKPLHKCDFYQNEAAGNKLKAGLGLGYSQHWSVALNTLTGDSEMSATALMEYFAPLQAFLKKENDMRDILDAYEVEAQDKYNKLTKAEWDVATDTGNTVKEEALNAAVLENAVFAKKNYQDHFEGVNPDEYAEITKRQLKQLTRLGRDVLNEADLSNLTKTSTSIENIYNFAKICPYNKQDCNLLTEGLTLDPEISAIMTNSTNYDELKWAWHQWHDKSGKLMRDGYKTYVELNNKAAVANGRKDNGEMWREAYEDPNFVENVDKMWSQVEPLYNELHTYVRRQLLKIYGSEMDKDSDLIPAHVLGNMWAQSWVNLYERIKPYKDGSLIDITEKLKETMSVLDMFKESDRFYKDLGLESNEMSYDESKGAVINKPTDRTITCHASAWDFYDKTDFRIKMCTNIDQEDFVTVHHEMGHIQYYILYKDQPLVLRSGANPGFHEAVGDLIALSVSTPQHLEKIGLLQDYADTQGDNINALFKMALERVAFLPFGLLIDKWRWDVFSGAVPEAEWNKHWWELREKYQKVQAPVARDETDFDPGAKYHVPSDTPYIRYFIAHILQFQMHRAVCIEAGQYVKTDPTKPLHKCDIDGSKEAGAKIRAGLELGLSQHWSMALERMTGEKEISGDAVLEYFKPLYDYLKAENMKEVLQEYEVEAQDLYSKLTKVSWDVATDTGNTVKEEALNAAVLENARFAKKYYEDHFKGVNPDDYTDELVKRELKQLTVLGRDALDEADLDELTKTSTSIENIYNFAKICPYNKQDCNLPTEGLTLDPEISAIMTNSGNYDELKWAWQQWRDKSGKLMRDGYKKYVELNNKAAVANGRKDTGEMWREAYEDPNFVANVDKMWSQVEPLYNELHTYVRRKLQKIYDKNMDKDSDLIPAHVLGNMWAQSWVNLYERIKPYKDGSLIDITEKLKEKMSVLDMFKESDRFYKDLGLESNGMSYDESKGAVINKPTDRTITCHASAWDFYDKTDFRIKMCTNIDQEDFVTVHHEMGHIQYFILYKDQPVVLRTGANPGFHEAVGDLIALSVSTPQHLEKIGLLEGYKNTDEDNINALFKMALERVAFLPFGLLIDKWRWDVFSGAVPETEWNKHWWELREKYQKVSAPVSRNETDFDPGAKYHVPSDTPYIRYFIAHILQFQMHRAVCIAAGQYVQGDSSKPLHKCDIDGSKEAGAKIRAGLELGLSQHWSVALERMTGEKEISGDAVLEYFKPLYDYLKAENEKDDESSGNGKIIAIIVGSVVGGIVLIGVLTFGIVKYNRNKRTNDF